MSKPETVESFTEALYNGAALSDQSLYLALGGCTLRIRSNSSEHISQLTRYFSHAVGPEADLYSLGVMLYECLLGAPVWKELSPSQLRDPDQRPEDVLGMHFFSPAHIMKLLEVVRADKTADDVLATVMALSKKIRKVAVVSGVCYGFIGNRMLQGYFREAQLCLIEGGSPQSVDKAMFDWGMAMGPISVGDLAGLDVGVGGLEHDVGVRSLNGKPELARSCLDQLDLEGQRRTRAARGLGALAVS